MKSRNITVAAFWFLMLLLFISPDNSPNYLPLCFCPGHTPTENLSILGLVGGLTSYQEWLLVQVIGISTQHHLIPNL